MPKQNECAETVTARCRDCPKTYTATGDLLHNMIAVHELKGHIVDAENASGKA